jgi:hypothetical protein
MTAYVSHDVGGRTSEDQRGNGGEESNESKSGGLGDCSRIIPRQILLMVDDRGTGQVDYLFVPAAFSCCLLVL